MRDRSGKLIEKARERGPGGHLRRRRRDSWSRRSPPTCFVIVARRGLSDPQYSAFGAFWAFIFVAGPGLFLPLEQEVGRALAHRRAQGIGGGPLVHRAALARRRSSRGDGRARARHRAAVVDEPVPRRTGCWSRASRSGSSASTACTPPAGRSRATAASGRTARCSPRRASSGSPARRPARGRRRQRRRRTACASCSRRSSRSPCRCARPAELLEPGPAAPYSELSNALGWLLAGSVLMQLLGYSLAARRQHARRAGRHGARRRVHTGFFVARIPTSLFQAVQGTLLPKLAGLAGAGRHDDFRSRAAKARRDRHRHRRSSAPSPASRSAPRSARSCSRQFNIDQPRPRAPRGRERLFIIALTVAQALSRSRATRGGARLAASASSRSSP